MSKVPYILSHLTEDDVDWLLAAGERREIPAGTVLIAEGQPTDAPAGSGPALARRALMLAGHRTRGGGPAHRCRAC